MSWGRNNITFSYRRDVSTADAVVRSFGLCCWADCRRDSQGSEAHTSCFALCAELVTAFTKIWNLQFFCGSNFELKGFSPQLAISCCSLVLIMFCVTDRRHCSLFRLSMRASAAPVGRFRHGAALAADQVAPSRRGARLWSVLRAYVEPVRQAATVGAFVRLTERSRTKNDCQKAYDRTIPWNILKNITEPLKCVPNL